MIEVDVIRAGPSGAWALPRSCPGSGLRSYWTPCEGAVDALPAPRESLEKGKRKPFDDYYETLKVGERIY